MIILTTEQLLELISPNVTDETLASATNTATVSGGQLFRKYLLNRCQEDYERGWSDRQKAATAAAEKASEDQAKKDANEKRAADDLAAGVSKEEPKEAELLSDEYYAAAKAKRRGLGLVRFIGELYKLNMLTSRIMHDCIQKLLGNVDNPEEDDVESLCRLLTTVGQQLDEDPKGEHKSRQIMTIYFKRLQDIADSPRVNSRIRFMVLVRLVALCGMHN
jgi:translation initiation factor 4G